MNTEITDSPRPARMFEIISAREPHFEESMWGAVPIEQRLDWLRAAASSWPYFPGVTAGSMTDQALASGQLVRSAALVRVARNAFEAGFTPDEYRELRRLIRGVAPDHLVVKRDVHERFAARYFEIDARMWRGWLDLVRDGMPSDKALERFLAE